MIDLPTWTTFVAAALALLIAPGPAVLYLVARSASEGRTAGFVSCLGLASGGLVHVALGAAGVTALAGAGGALRALRWAGAAYLVWLGIRTLTERPGGPAEPGPVAPGALGRIYRDGFLVNLLNPKSLVFLLAFVPQFVDPSAGRPAAQFLVLGLAFLGLGFATDSAYVLTASALGARAGRSAAVRRTGRGLAAAVYLALGLAAALGGDAF